MLVGGTGVSLRQPDKSGLKSWKSTKSEIFARLLEMRFLKAQGHLKMEFENEITLNRRTWGSREAVLSV